MRWDSFRGTLAFGALVASALPAIWLGLGPLLGHADAVGGYLIGVSVVYVALIGGRRPGRWRATAGAAAAGVVLFTFVPSFAARALGAALLLAGSRAWMYGAAPLRALAIEAVLTGAGLLLARTLLGAGPISLALALWAYLLVQSAFFLIARRVQAPGIDDSDGFEQARQRLLRLLEEETF